MDASNYVEKTLNDFRTTPRHWMTPSSHDAFADGAPPPARESTAAPVGMDLDSRNDEDGNSNVAAGRSERATIAGEVAMKEGLGNATATRVKCQSAADDGGVVVGDGIRDRKPSSNNTTTNNKNNDLARKVGVGLAGSALIVAGVPLIPLPGPGDFMVVGGLALLATEFPAAQRVVDGARDALASSLGDEAESSQPSFSGKEADEEEAEEDTEGHDDAEEEEHGDCCAAVRNRDEYSRSGYAGDEMMHAIQNGMEDAATNAIRGARWFGRHAALPLLDKIATDRRSTEVKAKTTSSRNEEGEDGTNVAKKNSGYGHAG